MPVYLAKIKSLFYHYECRCACTYVGDVLSYADLVVVECVHMSEGRESERKVVFIM